MRRVRALGPGSGGTVPAAALTAYTQAEDRRAGREHDLELRGEQAEADRQTRAGELLAATPISRFSYLLGKCFSNFAVLAGAMGIMLLANLGTTTAEFAGIAAAFQILGVSRYIAVPAAALLVHGTSSANGTWVRSRKVRTRRCTSISTSICSWLA